MTSEPIFRILPPEILSHASEYLKWDPLVSTSQPKLLSQCSPEQRLAWLDTHRTELEQHISWVGTPIFSYAVGNSKNYQQIVADVATQLGAPVRPDENIAQIETKLLGKVWSDTLSRLTNEEREALLAKVSQWPHDMGPR